MVLGVSGTDVSKTQLQPWKDVQSGERDTDICTQLQQSVTIYTKTCSSQNRRNPHSPREGGKKSVPGKSEGPGAHFSKPEHRGRSSCRQMSV